MSEDQICALLMKLGAKLDWAEHAAKFLYRDYKIEERAAYLISSQDGAAQ